MELGELEPICLNCSYFFPTSMDEATDYGICLYDDAFEPYIEELLENYNYDSCKELIEEKKIHEGTEACEHFEEPIVVEIDDNTHLGRALKDFKNSGRIDSDELERARLLDELERIDLKTIPIENNLADLNNPDKNKRLQAVSTLGMLANLGNKNAADELTEYFKKLSPPNTIDEVHTKLEAFQHIKRMGNEAAIIPLLINDLSRIQSNNTTRKWISEILQYFEHCPIDMIRDPLEKLLKEKKFSHKMKNRIKDTIIASAVNSI